MPKRRNAIIVVSDLISKKQRESNNFLAAGAFSRNYFDVVGWNQMEYVEANCAEKLRSSIKRARTEHPPL